MKIEKKRFGQKLNVVYDIKAKDFFIPALTLQPIVENAVRYGVTKKEHGGTVSIKTSETETEFMITVIDDGEGFDAKTVAIEDGRSRLAAMCGGTLEIKSVPGKGTTAIISISKGDNHG